MQQSYYYYYYYFYYYYYYPTLLITLHYNTDSKITLSGTKSWMST